MGLLPVLHLAPFCPTSCWLDGVFLAVSSIVLCLLPLSSDTSLALQGHNAVNNSSALRASGILTALLGVPLPELFSDTFTGRAEFLLAESSFL